MIISSESESQGISIYSEKRLYLPLSSNMENSLCDCVAMCNLYSIFVVTRCVLPNSN